jgi:hypothetical protein
LGKRKLLKSGNKKLLVERVYEVLGNDQEAALLDVDKPKGDENRARKSARKAVCEFSPVESVKVGDTLLYVSKDQNGKTDKTDMFGLFVVCVTGAPEDLPANCKDKGELEESQRLVQFGLQRDDVLEPEEAHISHFFSMPSDLLRGTYEKNHLVLFRRTRNRKLLSQLELGWLASKYDKHKDKEVHILSYDEEALVAPRDVIFDAFGAAQRTRSDVEVKLILFEIEFSTDRSNAEDKAPSSSSSSE